MRKRLAAAAVIVAASLGLGGYALAADAPTTGTASVCATATAQTHTVIVDSIPVKTVGGDVATNCATTTYTIPTVTVGGTTAPVATTVTTPTTTTTPTPTTTTSGIPTFASEIAYTQIRPAFAPTRTIVVSSAAALRSAIANLQPGDLVEASAPFTVTGSANSPPLSISARLSGYAEIDLTGVTVTYTGTYEQPAVQLLNTSHIRIWGGDISSGQGGSCAKWYAGQYTTWWGFKAHNCGADGLSLFTGRSGYSYTGPVQHNDIEGDVSHTGQHPAWDPHAEKCSGLHGANMADGNYFDFSNNRVALNVHDTSCIGGGIEFGASQSTNIPDHNTIILQCSNLTFASVTQTGSNCYQTWGYGNTNTDLKYVVSTNIDGHNVWAGGLYNKPNSKLATDTIEYARATSTDLNPRYTSDCTNNKEGNPVFRDAAPAPCYKPFSS